MSLDLLATECESAADLVDGVTKLLNIIAQHGERIDPKTAAHLAELLRRIPVNLFHLAEELHTLSLALASPASEHEH